MFSLVTWGELFLSDYLLTASSNIIAIQKNGINLRGHLMVFSHLENTFYISSGARFKYSSSEWRTVRIKKMNSPTIWLRGAHTQFIISLSYFKILERILVWCGWHGAAGSAPWRAPRHSGHSMGKLQNSYPADQNYPSTITCMSISLGNNREVFSYK